MCREDKRHTGMRNPGDLPISTHLQINKGMNPVYKLAVDREYKPDILTVEEVARFLSKSPSWVYKHWQELGGRKLGGSLFFPHKEELYERIFGKRQGVEVRLHPQGNQADWSLVQDKNRGAKSRNRKEGRAKATQTGGEDPNRHGIFGAGQ